ncbi:3-oxoacid CoA-transferase [Arcicella sp. LKC2W]|uniref:3-oxoacid CoA-transferase n=1 Tax=Arcicella sp. LKC2W TaxID=2984198 RepID=UPI002B204FE9|nr:3-oxoacid CoA-transferase [Arcicella sp. LKC2W]MEA5461097.1 3-oxoacid CoA-transferase [Arcicella sp. LKC2W]
MMNKVVENVQKALQDVTDGVVIMFGGFGLCGIPENSITELIAKKVKNLTCISNNAGTDNFGLGLMLKNKQIKKMISSYVGENQEFERQLLSGVLEVELIPQGTLAERIRAGGAGIPAFFTPAGVGTEIENGKQLQEFEGKKYLMESWLKADFAIIKAWKGDTAGNLIFRGTAQNFNPLMATAGKITIAEVEELVEVGTLNPNEVQLPGIYVQRIFKGSQYTKKIEQRMVTEQNRNEQNLEKLQTLGISKKQIAQRIAKEIKDGYYVNLGIGIPTLVANYLSPQINVVLQSENGLLGIGPFPNESEIDADFINAGKQTITLQKGASLFNSAESFNMIRGEHIDLTILGAMEVSESGDIANWKIPYKMVKGMGGAMDLVASAKNIIVAMQHLSKDGKSKLLPECTLPLTGINCVKKIVTELAVLEVLPEGGFKLLEKAPGVSIEYIKEVTLGRLIVDEHTPDITFDF